MKDSQASVPAMRERPAVWLMARVGGAIATLAVGGVHLQQYVTLYTSAPTIGTLFVLNFAGATLIAVVLLAPVERVAGAPGPTAVALAALAGIGLAATSFAFCSSASTRRCSGSTNPATTRARDRVLRECRSSSPSRC